MPTDTKRKGFLALTAVSLLCAAIPAIPVRADASGWIVDRWSVEQGLPNNALSDILQIRGGYLWIATWAGIVRFDGVRFTPIAGSLLTGEAMQRWRAADGLPAGSVVALREDPEGSVWVGSVNGGLARLKRTRVVTYAVAHGLPAAVVGSIVEDGKGTIYAGSDCGPVSELRQGRFVPRFVEYTGDACALVLWPARDGSLWIGTRGRGLFHWTGGRMDHFGLDEGLSDTIVRGLFEDRDGVIWIGTETGGLHRYADGRLSRAFGAADGVATYVLASFAQDRHGRVWIGSNGNGLTIFEDGRFRTLAPDESPPTRDIAGLLIDSRGDLWIGSAADGLFRFRNGRFERFGVAQGLGDRLVAVMLEDRAGNMWVGTLLLTGLVVSTVSQRRARRRLDDLERAHALERERTRIARDLHDDLGSRLSHIALMAEHAGAASSPLGLANAALDAVGVLDELVWAVNARNDTVEGFATYASRFAEAHVAAAGLRYRAHLPGDLALYELRSDTRRHLYLAVKEAVNNAVKHADATEIGLHISVESHELCLHITDNGRGIPSRGGDPTGNGLTSMRERLAAVRGTVQFNPSPGGGTSVVFTVPVTPKTT